MSDAASIEHPAWLTGGDFTEADEPFRLFGALLRICPPLGDLAFSTLTQQLERRGDLNRKPAQVGDARTRE